jgi:hypothetical protein
LLGDLAKSRAGLVASDRLAWISGLTHHVRFRAHDPDPRPFEHYYLS